MSSVDNHSIKQLWFFFFFFVNFSVDPFLVLYFLEKQQVLSKFPRQNSKVKVI